MQTHFIHLLDRGRGKASICQCDAIYIFACSTANFRMLEGTCVCVCVCVCVLVLQGSAFGSVCVLCVYQGACVSVECVCMCVNIDDFMYTLAPI